MLEVEGVARLSSVSGDLRTIDVEFPHHPLVLLHPLGYWSSRLADVTPGAGSAGKAVDGAESNRLLRPLSHQ